MEWIDTHCHLDSLEIELDDAIQKAAIAGVVSMVTIGTDVESSARAVRMASQHAAVWCSVGVDPHEAGLFDRETSDKIRDLASEERVVAIGEIGLDFYRNDSPRAVQVDTFASQLDLAASVGKPVVLHVRETFKEVFEILQGRTLRGIVFHCFSGTVDDALHAVEIGAHLSFAGNVSYKTADNLRRAAASIPVDRILLETDSPYLTPVPHRGKPNDPSMVPLVGAAVANAIGMPIEELAAITTRNAIELFGLIA